ADVNTQYQRAGDAWVQAAAARPEPERPDALWRGVQCFLLAKQEPRAQKLLHEFVTLPMTEVRLAEAWLTLGDLYRVAGNKDNAHRAYVKCMEYPKTPFAFRARFWLAVEEEVDNKNFEKAYAILQDSLIDQSVEVERAWQERSAFKMA